MKKILIVTMMFIATYASANEMISPHQMRSGYKGLTPKAPNASHLIGKWKSLGGANVFESKNWKTSDFEFRVWDKYPEKVNLYVQQNGQTGLVFDVSFQSKDSKSLGENILKGKTFNSTPPCTPEKNGRCPVVFSEMDFNYNHAQILSADKKNYINFTLHDCTSIGDLYLICETSVGDDDYEDVQEVFVREFPAVPTIKAIDEIEAISVKK